MRKPVFMSIDLETPLALATFLANNAHLHKVFIPSTFNMSHILNNLKHQESEVVVCDKEFFELSPPSNRLDEYRNMTKNVQKVIVGSDEKLGSSNLFKGQAVNVDPYKLNL